MPNQWFRLYAEFATDPKVQRLSEVDQRRFIMILCLRCCNGDVTLHDEDVTFQLRISNDEWNVTKSKLIEKSLINERNQPVAWNTRQYLSDSSVERVRKHRENVKRYSNVTVTAPETETETETEDHILVNSKPKTKLKKSDDCPYQEILNQFTEILSELPQPNSLSAGRKRNIKARWKEYPHIDHFRQIFHSVKQSNFLMGRNRPKNDSGWQAGLDWIVTSRNWEKINDGNYDNK